MKTRHLIEFISRLSNVLIFPLSSILLLVSSSVFATDSLRYETHVRPLLEKHCIKCHNTNSPKAGVNIDNYKEHERVIKDGAFWLKILDQIKTREMPPKTEPALSEFEYAKLVGNIDSILQTSLKNKMPGQVVIRRLSHAEYKYTIKDLFEVDFDASGYFPSDGSGGGGFDNQGKALFFTPLKLERYYDAGDQIVEALLADNEKWEKIVPFAFQASGWQGIINWFKSIFSNQYMHLTDERLASEKVVDATVTKIYRRFLKPHEKEKLLTLFHEVYDQNYDLENPKRFNLSIAQVLKASLVSPNFLYKIEEEPANNKPYPLNDFEVANRLSYFLWCSCPDEELYQLAQASKLHDPEVLKSQVKRMLSSSKSKRFTENFTSQWLGITKLIEPQPMVDEELYPGFDLEIRKELYQEASEFFYHILTKSRNLMDLVTSDYSILNKNLAEFYGIEGVENQNFQKVQFTDNKRGGILGMGSVLATTSLSTRTSPVLRGKWVMEQILGVSPPPPPAEVSALTEDKSIHEALGLRKILEMHRSNPECRSCHEKMDPLGLGLENYDPRGKWRETYEKVKIDASGITADGEKFNGPAELKLILQKQDKKIARNLSKRMLSYALGRSILFTDEPALVHLENTLLQNNFDPEPFLIELVRSYPFLLKINDFEKKAV